MTDQDESSLAAGRAAIARIDSRIVQLIADRVDAGVALARTKRRRGLPLADLHQEALVVRRAARHARDAQLPEEPVRGLFWQLIALTRAAQSGDR